MEASSGFHRVEASGDRSLVFELFELSVRRQDKSIWSDPGGQALFPTTRDQEWQGQSLMKVCVCVCVCACMCAYVGRCLFHRGFSTFLGFESGRLGSKTQTVCIGSIAQTCFSNMLGFC